MHLTDTMSAINKQQQKPVSTAHSPFPACMAVLVPEGKDEDLIADCSVLLCEGIQVLLVFLGEVHHTQDNEGHVAEMLLESNATLLFQHRDEGLSSLSQSR